MSFWLGRTRTQGQKDTFYPASGVAANSPEILAYNKGTKSGPVWQRRGPRVASVERKPSTMKETLSGQSSNLASDPATGAQDPAFDALEGTLRRSGPPGAIEQLIGHLDQTGDYRSLLDALLLRARYDLNLPLIQDGGLSNLAEPVRTQFEDRYVEAIRLVGSKFLAAGDIPTAWTYFRVIAEPEPVKAALDGYEADRDAERLGLVIDVAFNQGANPRRGFELILDQYGTCSAITALEQVPPGDAATQIACIERLIRHLHAQLVFSIRADLASGGHAVPGEAASIAELIAGRDWLFADEAYHIDVSHLSATVRYAIMVSDPAILALAVDLTEYGRRLASRLQFEGCHPSSRPSRTTASSSAPSWARMWMRR